MFRKRRTFARRGARASIPMPPWPVTLGVAAVAVGVAVLWLAQVAENSPPVRQEVRIELPDAFR